MSTTSMFVEILIVGIEALICLGLLLCTIWDSSRILDKFIYYKEYSALITTLLLALAYVLGILIDRVADSFYSLFRYSADEYPRVSVGKMRLQIMHDGEGMAKFLDYQRSRLRIARATVLNLFLILLVAPFSLHRYYDGNYAYAVTLMIIVGILALGVSLIAARRIDMAQMLRLIEAYEIVAEKKGDNAMPRQIAAAVCYRRKDGKIEFLLVRTKDGEFWTFPKGHVKRHPPEPLWHAAAREAKEEAGVSGSIEKKPFTYYSYSKGANAKEDLVFAFLMSVELEDEPDEDGRDPQWFTPELAIKKLTERRQKKYVREHKQLVQKAMARLG